MRRKDGQDKIKSPRSYPKFDRGFTELNPLPKAHQPTQNIVSFFTGCGGLELGMLGGFRFLNRHLRRLPFETIRAFDILCGRNISSEYW